MSEKLCEKVDLRRSRRSTVINQLVSLLHEHYILHGTSDFQIYWKLTGLFMQRNELIDNGWSSWPPQDPLSRRVFHSSSNLQTYLYNFFKDKFQQQNTTIVAELNYYGFNWSKKKKKKNALKAVTTTTLLLLLLQWRCKKHNKLFHIDCNIDVIILAVKICCFLGYY